MPDPIKFEATAVKGSYYSESGQRYATWQTPDVHGWYRGSPNIGVWDFGGGALERMPDGARVKITVEVVDDGD
jgi:hypothetical protein